MKKLDYDIIVLALPRWDGLYSSTAFSLSKELSRYTRVFYIDNPFTLKDFILNYSSSQIKRRRNALLRGVESFVVPDKSYPEIVTVTPQLVLPINWLPSGAIYDFFSSINDRILYKAIRKLRAAYNIQKFVFINSFNPLYGRYFPDDFAPALKIYQCVDDISRSLYISKHGTTLEREALKTADFTLVTSLELKRLKSKETNEVVYHPNAADVELFQKALHNGLAKPKEMQQIPEGAKVIFYMGNICHRLDYDLLEKISEQHPDKFLVLVGPQTYDQYKKVGLDRKTNVIFTGRKSLEELPSYLHYSDCCIIPFVCNTLTRSIYPLKINEYLSAGKPVITTNFSEDIATFAEVAYVSSSHEDFLQNITAALAENSNERIIQRVDFAAGNNWKARAKDLVDMMNRKIRQE